MDYTSKLKTYWNSEPAFKWLAFKVYFLLGFGRAAVLLIPFKTIAAWMGKINVETQVSPIDLKKDRLDDLGKAIRAVSPLTPWKSNCFAQALCAHWLLKARSVEHTIYFGVKHDEGKKFEAHAWLRAGTRIITGAARHRDYSVVGAFAYIPGKTS